MEFDFKVFNLISDFVKELDSIFGEKQKPVRLYSHLVSRTKAVQTHIKPIEKHIRAFRNFCSEYQEGILSRDASKIPAEAKISYSEKVFLDMSKIFRDADRENKEVIWQYLLTISAMLDPTSKAKQVLQEQRSAPKKGGKEAEFLGSIISRVESSVDSETDNPMTAVGNILSSGLFTELITGMSSGLQNGDLDLNNLIGTVQKMVVGMGGEGENGGGGHMDMLSNMMGTLSATVGDRPRVLDVTEDPEEKGATAEDSTPELD